MGSDTADSRGTHVANFIEKNNLNILNNDNDIRISGPSRSSIDLSIIYPSLQPQIEWLVSESPLDSDHCINEIKIQIGVQRVQDGNKTFNVKKANWAKYQTHAVWNQGLNLVQELPAEQQIHNFCANVKTAVEDSIPKAIIRKFYPKRW